jgi:glucose/arabinose dehydrogenase
MRELRHPRVAFASAVLVAAAGLAAGASAATAPPRPAGTGTIYSVAGAGLFLIGGQAVAPAAPDGGPAGVTRLAYPTGVAALPDGGFLVAEQYGNRIRRVSARGVITTVAGTRRAGFSGDGGPATAARLDHPSAVAALADGAVAIADQWNNRIRLVDTSGRISTLAAARLPTGSHRPPTAGSLWWRP